MTVTAPSLFSGQYYQLANLQSGSTPNTQSNPADAILQALSATGGSGLLGDNSQNSSSSDNAFLLNLSPQAQSLLSGSSTGLFSLTGGNGFALSVTQQQQVSAILAKYKDAPFTQDTFNQIQHDLKAAGLSPDQLAAKNEVLNIQASDSSFLLNALDGTDTSTLPTLPDASSIMGSEQSNANAYMQQVFRQWQNISATAGASSAASPAAPTTSLTA